MYDATRVLSSRLMAAVEYDLNGQKYVTITLLVGPRRAFGHANVPPWHSQVHRAVVHSGKRLNCQKL